MSDRGHLGSLFALFCYDLSVFVRFFEIFFVSLSCKCMRNVMSALYFCQHNKKEVCMVSVDFKEERNNILVGILMIVLSILFLFFMGRSMVQSTQSFWNGCVMEHLLD